MQISPLPCYIPTCSAFTPFLNVCPFVSERHAWPHYGEIGFLPTSQLWQGLKGTGKPSSAQCQPTGHPEFIVLLTLLLICMMNTSQDSRVIPTAQQYWCETSGSCLSCCISCSYYPSWSFAAASVIRVQYRWSSSLSLFLPLWNHGDGVWSSQNAKSMVISIATETAGPA